MLSPEIRSILNGEALFENPDVDIGETLMIASCFLGIRSYTIVAEHAAGCWSLDLGNNIKGALDGNPHRIAKDLWTPRHKTRADRRKRLMAWALELDRWALESDRGAFGDVAWFLGSRTIEAIEKVEDLC